MTEQNPPAAAFHQRAERERNRLRMNKSQLSERSGVARKTYDRLAIQPNKAMPETILDIAEALGINVDEALELAGLEGIPARERAVEVAAQDALIAALMKRLPDVDETTIARVLLNAAAILQDAAAAALSRQSVPEEDAAPGMPSPV